MSYGFQIHTPSSEFNSSTLGRFGRMLSTDVLTPATANVLTFNNGQWEAVAPAMAMNSSFSNYRSSVPEMNFHYNISERPDVNIQYNVSEGDGASVEPSPPPINIISNYNVAEREGFRREDFIALLGEDETNNLFSVLSSVLLSEDITSVGDRAGRTGRSNVFIGGEAGRTSTGTKNTMIGSGSGAYSEEGSYNTVIGAEAGLNVSGSGNTLLGVVAGASVKEGGWNTFVGQSSGNFVVSGSGNVCVGSNSGLSLETGDGNVVIGEGADVSSSKAENQIVIGKGVMGYGDNTITFPKNLTPFPSGTEVNFSSTGGGCLYPVSSSLKWKTDIKDISESFDTSLLYSLRPVSYKTKIGHGDTTATHIGLIAEEVDELFPCVVPKDDKGEPASVRYSLLPVLVIEELKKLKQQVERMCVSKSRKEPSV